MKSPWHPPTRTSSSPTATGTRSIASVSRSRAAAIASATRRPARSGATSAWRRAARRPSSNASPTSSAAASGIGQLTPTPPRTGTQRRHHQHLHPTPVRVAEQLRRSTTIPRPFTDPARPALGLTDARGRCDAAVSPIFAKATASPRAVEHSQHRLAVRAGGPDAQADLTGSPDTSASTATMWSSPRARRHGCDHARAGPTHARGLRRPTTDAARTSRAGQRGAVPGERRSADPSAPPGAAAGRSRVGHRQQLPRRRSPRRASDARRRARRADLGGLGPETFARSRIERDDRRRPAASVIRDQRTEVPMRLPTARRATSGRHAEPEVASVANGAAGCPPRAGTHDQRARRSSTEQHPRDDRAPPPAIGPIGRPPGAAPRPPRSRQQLQRSSSWPRSSSSARTLVAATLRRVVAAVRPARAGRRVELAAQLLADLVAALLEVVGRAPAR